MAFLLLHNYTDFIENRKDLENFVPDWNTPSGQIRWMGIACWTDLGTLNFSRSIFNACCKVLIKRTTPS